MLSSPGFAAANGRVVSFYVATILLLVLLAACTTETTTDPASETDSTAGPTAVPTATPIPYETFATAEIPPADPERLAQLTNLLSLVPVEFGSAVYLDLEFLRSNEALAGLISPEGLSMAVALPSFATGVVNTVAMASNQEGNGLLTPFQSTFQIGDLLKVAGGFGLQLGGDGPTSYEGHDVWDVGLLGTNVTMATADDTTGVAASGRGITDEAVRGLVESSLDAFDGRSATLIDTPGLTGLLGDVPSGFAAAVLSKCDVFPLLSSISGTDGCIRVAVSADILPGELIVLHGLIGFADQDSAAAAMELTSRALGNEKLAQEFVDLGVRQEKENLRVRLIVDADKFGGAFALFAPRN
ncbi:MAG: hypothetical protein CL902_12975 [Dehalococcoidia bacterium]|nr:hypothetical protein [Dehalococcoidia bacterium]